MNDECMDDGNEDDECMNHCIKFHLLSFPHLSVGYSKAHVL